MQFAEGSYFHGIWVWLLLGYLLVWLHKRYRRQRDRLIDPRLASAVYPDARPERKVWRNALLMGVVLFSILALTRPQWGFEWREISKRGIDIMMVVDVSKSMLTQDVRPNRLERTRLAIQELLKRLKGDRVGLTAFAGDAFLMSPLTSDYGGFQLTLEELSVDSVPLGGTDIATAIDTALESFEEGPAQHKVIVLVTDGDNLRGAPLEAARRADQEGVKIYTIGIGTRDGELIQIINEAGEREFLKDREGNFVKSRLNERLLQEIALETGGIYVRAGGVDFGLDVVYDRELARLEGRELETSRERRYYERFQIPLAIAVLLLLLESFTGSAIRRTGLFLIVAILAGRALPVHATEFTSTAREANTAFEEQKYEEAVTKYTEALHINPDSDIIHFNLGTALHKDGQNEKALHHLNQALLSSSDERRARAHYNMGNVFYTIGAERDMMSMKQTEEDWKEAIAHFESALMLNPEDEDAEHNLNFVRQRLEQLRQEQQKQKSQQQSQESQQGQDQDSESGQSGESGQQSGDRDSSEDRQNPSDPSSGQDSDESDSSDREGDGSPKQQPRSGDPSGRDPSREKSEQEQMRYRPDEITPREAEMMIDSYLQKEGNQGFLNFHQRKTNPPEDLQDW